METPVKNADISQLNLKIKLEISGSVFTKICKIFLRITRKSKKNSKPRIFLFLE